jgi:hypothetical protein
MAQKTITPEAALAAVAAIDAVMQALDSHVLQHVSLRNPDGADSRLDGCPCRRGSDTVASGELVELVELGGGQYLSSGRHTLGDVVRDALPADNA